MSENTTTPIGGWIKAVFMQEGNLPTVADCCRLAALVEHGVRAKDEPYLRPDDVTSLRIALLALDGIEGIDKQVAADKLRAIIVKVEIKP